MDRPPTFDLHILLVDSAFVTATILFLAAQWSLFRVARRPYEQAFVLDAPAVVLLLILSLSAFPLALFVMLEALVVSGDLVWITLVLVVAGSVGFACGVFRAVVSLRARRL